MKYLNMDKLAISFPQFILWKLYRSSLNLVYLNVNERMDEEMHA